MTKAPASPDEDDLNNRIKSIFASPDVSKKIIAAVTTKKPPGWGRKSCAPYYKEPYGKQLQQMADEMIRSRQSIVFDYARFCYDTSNPARMSTKSLYLRVNQSINFLLNEIDLHLPDHPYAKWHAMVKVRVKADVGVIIEYIPELVNYELGEGLLSPKMMTPLSDKPKWREAMAKWLEDSSDGRPFVKENLCLTKEDREEIERELAGLENILADIETTHVKLIKMQ